MSQQFFDLSSFEYKRFDDGNYVYDLHNDGGKLIIDIRSMHSMCRKAKPIKITVPDTINYYINLSRCFYRHNSLTDISALKSFDTSRVVNMSEMFSGCHKLTSIDALSEWDVTNVWDMSGMFFDCQSLDRLTELSEWNVSMDCILEAFYAKRVQFYQPIGKPPIGPIISMLGWEIKRKADINCLLNNNFPQWSIDRHKARDY